MSGYLGSFIIDDTCTFYANAHTPATGAAVDADAVPGYAVYEDETGTAILSGSMAKLDDAGTTGFYSEQITLSAANGFEAGKSYCIRITIVVGGVTGVQLQTLQIGARVDARMLGGTIQSATDLKDFADDGYDPATNKVQGVVLTDTVTTYTGNTPQTGDSFARLGAPAAASVSADILAIDNFVDDLESRLGTPSNLGSGATIAANLVDIEAQTDDIGAAGVGLTAITSLLPTALTADGNMKTDTLYAGGSVWYDTGGAAGTTSYVHGTLTNPVSSIANARTIADAVGVKIFRILNSSSVTLDQGYNAYTFTGERWTLALANRLITGSHFSGATVSGLSTGTGTEWDDCIIGTATIANDALFYNCELTGTLTLQAAGEFHLHGCFSHGGTDPIIDFGALGASTVNLSNYSGAIDVRNMAAGDVLILQGCGKLTINANCTAGTVRIRGSFVLVNNGSGQTIEDSARWDEDQRLANVTLVDTLTTNNDKTGYALSGAANNAIRDTILSDATTFAGANVDAAVSSRAPAATALSTAQWTNTRAVYLDNLAALKIKKNTALGKFKFLMVQSADHISPATGLTVVVQRSIDGAAFINAANTPATEISNGVYYIDLAAADLNGDVIALKMTSATADQRTIFIVTEP